MNYYRIKALEPKNNMTFIMDSFGAFEKLWEFSSFLIQKNCKILEVGTVDKFNTNNIPLLQNEHNKICLRKIF